MALINCPECGKEISDKAAACPHCGCPSSEWKNGDGLKSFGECADDKLEDKSSEVSVCPFCNNEIIIDDGYCPICGMRIEPVKSKHSINDVAPNCGKKEFHGIYRYGLFGGKYEVYCPRCGSENCSYYQEQKVIPGKTKTRYTANLNPLKPFTLVNKKEKVIKKDKTVTESKIMCNDCGHIFE